MKLLGCAGQNVLVFQFLGSQQRVVTMSVGYEVCPIDDQLQSVEQERHLQCHDGNNIF